MERWSIKFFNSLENRWERSYHYSLKEFQTAKEKIKDDPNIDQEKVFENYERFRQVHAEETVCPICSAELSAGHYYSCPKFEM